MDITLILAGLKAASELVGLYTRAAEAANNGNDVEAEEYLRQARSHYAASRATWDAAIAGR